MGIFRMNQAIYDSLIYMILIITKYLEFYQYFQFPMTSQNTDTGFQLTQPIILTKEQKLNSCLLPKQKNDSIQIKSKSLQEKVKNYLILYDKILGQGSFSQVYKAVVCNQIKQNDQKTKQQQILQFRPSTENQEYAAIKIIQKFMITNDLQKLLQSQMTILKIIKHENVVKCLQIFQDQKRIFIVTQLCNEGDLEKRIDTKGKIQQGQALLIIKDVLQGLLYLDRLNIIHRDLKIANIFIHNGRAKIADFGFSVINSKRNTFQDISIGSPIYMSPEGIKHHMYGPKTDVWSFGIMIYELLHGKTPYSHCKKQKQLKYNISVQIGWNSMNANISYGMKQLIMKCLQISYQKRMTIQQISKVDVFKKLENKNNGLRLKKNNEKSYEDLSSPLLHHVKSQKTIKKQNKGYNNQIRSKQKQKQKQRQKQLEKQKHIDTFDFHKEKQIKKNIYQPQSIIRHRPHRQTEESYQFSFVNTNKDHQTQKINSIQKIRRKQSKSPQFNEITTIKHSLHPQKNYESFRQNPQIAKMNSFMGMTTSLNLYKTQSPFSQFNKQQQFKQHRKVDLNFASNNINCYLYLIHFSRLCFKLSNLHFQLTKDGSVQQVIMGLCIFILESTKNKISHYLYEEIQCNKKQKNQLNLVKRTIQKYLQKYKYQNRTRSWAASQSFKKIQKAMTYLENQSEYCINQLIAKKPSYTAQNSKRQAIKLQFLVLHEGFKNNIKQIKQLLCLNDSQAQNRKKYFFDYKVKNFVRSLQKNIQLSEKKDLDVTKFFKIRKNVSNHVNTKAYLLT